MYHPYLSEQLSGEKETEFQSRADEARRTRRTGRRISGFITAVLVVGVLAGACGEGPVADDDATAGQAVQVANREAMLNQVVADLIRHNGPYLEQRSAVETASAVQPVLVPHWLLDINGPYAESAAVRAWLVPPWIPGANGPYAEADTSNVPANVR